MKLDQRKTGVILTYVNMAAGFLFSLVFTPVILRLLGQGEYGLYNLVASVVAYLGILNFGFGSAYIRYFSRYEIAQDEEKTAVLNGIFLLVFSVMGLVAMAAGFALTPFAGQIFGSQLEAAELGRARILMVILVANLGLSFPGLIFSTYLTAREQFVFQRLVQLVKTVLSPFVILLFLYLGYASVGMALAASLVSLAADLAHAYYCLHRLGMRFRFKKAEPGLVAEITVFSSYIFINMVIDQINWNVDKLLIGRFHGTVQVAIYGVASTLHSYYQQISLAVSNVFVPRVHRMVAESEDKGGLTRLFTSIGRIQFMLLSAVATLLIFFGQPFITRWAGSNYRDSYTVALFLILPVTIPLIQTIGIEIQRAKNMHQFRSVAYLLVALTNLAVSIPLTRLYGAVGAAAGTAFAMLLGNGLIMNLYNHFKVGLDMLYFWKEILSFVPALLLPVAAGLLIRWKANLTTIPNLFLFGLLYMGIFSLSFWFLGMNEDEKNLVKRPLKKRFYS